LAYPSLLGNIDLQKGTDSQVSLHKRKGKDEPGSHGAARAQPKRGLRGFRRGDGRGKRDGRKMDREQGSTAKKRRILAPAWDIGTQLGDGGPKKRDQTRPSKGLHQGRRGSWGQLKKAINSVALPLTGAG